MSQPHRTDPLPLGHEGEPPYSKGLMAKALIAVGVSAEHAYELARQVEADLAVRAESTVELERVHDLALQSLGADEAEDVTRRLRRYLELRELDLPVIVLLGGATGTGKSTIATELAYRLGITRVTSTDFVRQTMRAFFSREFMPSIHYSSFEAGDALRAPEEADDPAVAGFLDQTRNVLVGVHAAIERALEERWSMVLEGVHLVPGMLEPIAGDALVVQCVLRIDAADEHARHFEVRDVASDGVRPLAKYLERLEDIRRVQAEIVSRAVREGVPVVESGNVERALAEVMELVLAGVDRVQRV